MLKAEIKIEANELMEWLNKMNFLLCEVSEKLTELNKTLSETPSLSVTTNCRGVEVVNLDAVVKRIQQELADEISSNEVSAL